MKRRDKKKRRWIDKWRTKYRLVFITDDTLEERFTFRLSRLNVFIALGTLTIVLIFLTTILIAFTPLREYIPGYTNVGLTRKLHQMQLRVDSIEKALSARDAFIQNIRNVITGENLADKPQVRDTNKNYAGIRLKRSEEDSLLRLEVENQGKYNLNRLDGRDEKPSRRLSIGSILFFTPIKGVVVTRFDMAERHFGVDITTKQNEAVKAVLDGTVIMTDWTLETGYVITLQHTGNIVSVYKNNSAILRKTGDFVRSGEPISVVGASGGTNSVSSLHFEIWNDGVPVNPEDYVSF